MESSLSGLADIADIDFNQIKLSAPPVHTSDMAYWVKRIALKSGEVVTESELREDENLFDGPVPVVGDLIEVQCRGRKFTAEVTWGNWPGRVHPDNDPIPVKKYTSILRKLSDRSVLRIRRI